ncbi:MAG: nucleotidyltransferase domain-containing protein [Candidatus Muiribacteriota bacterium]|jgi:predicted nucleotidyltransferase
MDITNKAVEIIKNFLLQNNYDIVNIILFGSQATNSQSAASDFDFLVIINQNIDRKNRWNLIMKIKRILAQHNIPNDIILISEKEFNETKNNIGHITYYALKQGVSL